MRHVAAALVLLAALSPLDRASLAQQTYVVIVNSANPASEVKKDVVARLYLRKLRRWPDGKPAVPVDQSAMAAVRTAFARDVLGLTLGEVRDYWLKQTLSGAEVPPTTRSSDHDVIEFVAAEPGGLGYLHVGESLPPQVKTLKVTP